MCCKWRFGMTGIHFEDFEPCVPYPSYVSQGLVHMDPYPVSPNTARGPLKAQNMGLTAPSKTQRQRQQSPLTIFEDSLSSSTSTDSSSSPTPSFSSESPFCPDASSSTQTSKSHRRCRLPLTALQYTNQCAKSGQISSHCIKCGAQMEDCDGNGSRSPGASNARRYPGAVENLSEHTRHRKVGEATSPKSNSEVQHKKKVRFSPEIQEQASPAEASLGTSDLDDSAKSHIDPASPLNLQDEEFKPPVGNSSTSLTCNGYLTPPSLILKDGAKVFSFCNPFP